MSSNFSAFILMIFIPKKCSTKFSFWWGYWNSLKLSQRHNIVLRIKMTFIGKYLGRPILRWHLTSWSCLTTPAILYHSWICWNERLSILWFHLLMNEWNEIESQSSCSMRFDLLTDYTTLYDGKTFVLMILEKRRGPLYNLGRS